MNIYKKYIKYKTKYLNLKNQQLIGGKSMLKYNKYGKRQFKFNLKKFVNIKEGTDAIFIGEKMIVITKPGQIYEINMNDKSFIEINNIGKLEPDFTSEEKEEGLLGIANIKGKVYLSYTVRNKSNGTTLVISEYDLNKWKKIKDIFELSFINPYHHGGHIISTPNNKLILGTGDGGPQGDPHNQGQDINSYRAKILEIDPENKNIRILALGVRNPWLFSLDSKNRLWIGDVGWNTSESIKLMETLDRTYNFGWSIYEGSVHVPGKPNISFDSFDHLIWEYPTSDDTGRSILGGFFIDELNAYIFGDYLGFIRAIKFNNNKWECVAEYRLINNELFYSLVYDGKSIYILTDKQIYVLQIVSSNSKS